MIILICIFTDIGGYIFGNFFKGPKLTKISPNKTYAGAIGGFIFSVVSVLVYKNYITLPRPPVRAKVIPPITNKSFKNLS